MPIEYRADQSRVAKRFNRIRRRVAGAAALLLVSALTLVSAAVGRGAEAQGLNPFGGSTDQRPINITAENGIEWQQDKQVYIARGNAIARRGDSEVHADVLTAHYRPSKNKSADGGNEVYRLDADGHVVLKGPNQTVVGDQAVWDVDQQIGVVTGNHLRLTTPTDTVTARDSLEWYDQQQVAVARGDALAIRGDRRVRGDVLTAHFIKQSAAAKPAPGAATGKPEIVRAADSPVAAGRTAAASGNKAGAAAGKTRPGAPSDAAAGDSKISRVDAQGHVIVVTPTDVARGDYGVYNAQTGIVTLLGNVTITRGQDTVRGEYAVVDLNTNISRMMTVASKPGSPPPRVEGLFYRQDATAAANAAPKSGGKAASTGKASSAGKASSVVAPKSKS
jgi:lipopolysaccharide export system protein LptA